MCSLCKPGLQNSNDFYGFSGWSDCKFHYSGCIDFITNILTYSLWPAHRSVSGPTKDNRIVPPKGQGGRCSCMLLTDETKF
jgi:hypothetical protein